MDVRQRQESKHATQDGGGVTANKERAEALNNQKGEFPRPSSLEALPAKPLKAKGLRNLLSVFFCGHGGWGNNELTGPFANT